MGPLRTTLAAAATSLAVLTAPHLAAALGGEPPPVGGWLRPVDGPVVAPFDAPASRYGPGHRGADLGASPGTVVRAAGAGLVTFAGDVGGSLHVVVAHDGGLRTSYSFLSRVDVRAHQQVARGDPLGTTGGVSGDHDGTVLHLGLRVGDEYLDPMLLFGPPDLTEVVRLVPVDAPYGTPWSPLLEAVEIARAALADDGRDGGLVGGFVDAVTGASGAVVRALDDATADGIAAAGGAFDAFGAVAGRVATLAVEAWSHTPMAAFARDLAEMVTRFGDWVRGRDDCSTGSPPADATGGSGHLLMAVAGIGSSSRGAGDPPTDLDVEALGYYDGEVEYFSYARGGGAYEASDTWGDLLAAGRLLGEQLKAMHAEHPGREIDLVAHSQGGVVVDVFLQYVYDPADPAYPPIGTVVTLASPHRGAPLATAAGALERSRTGRAVLDAAAALPISPPDSASVRQLDEESDFLDDLWRHRLPEHVDFTTIGGTTDVVVPASKIDVSGATAVVVDVGVANDHTGIPTDPEALRAVRAALEGRPPPCTSFGDAVESSVFPVVITRFEHAVGDAGSLLP